MGAWRGSMAVLFLSLGWSALMGCSSSIARLKGILPVLQPASPPSTSSAAPPSNPSVAPSSRSRATLAKIDVRSLSGVSRVILEADRPVHASLFKASHPPVLFLDLEGVDLGLPERELMSASDGLIRSVRPFYIPQRDLARVEVHLERELSHRLEEAGNRLILELKGEEGGPAPQLIHASAGQASPPTLSEKPMEKKGPGSEGEKKAEEEEEEEAAVPQYIGRRISLDFQDADINTILRIIAEVSGLNVITSGDVRGKVTIRLMDVPWDQALDIILKTSGYAMVREGNIVRIAPPALFQKEQQEILLSRQTKEQADDLVTQVYPINYAMAEELQPHVTKLLSPRGSLTPDKRTNILIVKDLEKNLKEIRFLIDTLDKQTPQVAIHARILEVTKGFDREFGIDWSGNFDKSVSGNVSAAIGGRERRNEDTGEIELENPPSGTLDFLIDRIGRNSNINLDVRLQALETSNKVKVVSAPKITTLDNKEALIKTGKSIPFSTVSAEGTQVQLVDAVTELSVTPHITSDGYISMSIRVTRDEPDTSLAVTGATAAGLIKREARTDVIVLDGDTLVIGGIFKRTDTTATRAVPFLNRIPILGWLFRSEIVKDDNDEILIFITPHIVPRKPSA